MKICGAATLSRGKLATAVGAAAALCVTVSDVVRRWKTGLARDGVFDLEDAVHVRTVVSHQYAEVQQGMTYRRHFPTEVPCLVMHY